MHIHNIHNGTWTQTRQLSDTLHYTIWLYIAVADLRRWSMSQIR